jgi:hypothetical protein
VSWCWSGCLNLLIIGKTVILYVVWMSKSGA